ncbi:pyridoxine 5'-phosphate synthase [Candidatus Pelagibacter ubique]|nr:pyridoxine 5'-phosphate synthase [Candidatus Pelagibacter ubique]
MEVHAGHGLDYKTTSILSKIKEITEFNIGHFIIGESLTHGLKKTIKIFKKITNK